MKQGGGELTGANFLAIALERLPAHRLKELKEDNSRKEKEVNKNIYSRGERFSEFFGCLRVNPRGNLTTF